MKQKFAISITLSALAVLMVQISTFAQDGNTSGDSYSTSSYQERVQYTPGGEEAPASGKVKSQPSTLKDSVIVKPVIRSNYDSETAKSESEDDSVISFNFLYYIIRKYKLQDIVD